MNRSSLTFTLALAAIAASAPAMADRFHHGGYGWHGYYGDPWWWAVPPMVYLGTVPQVVYPDTPPVVVQQAPQPSTIVVQPPVSGPGAQGTAAPAPTWYYCTSAKSYYPYVNSCPEGWKAVPATPPDVH
jgi:hypothetical protein